MFVILVILVAVAVVVTIGLFCCFQPEAIFYLTSYFFVDDENAKPSKLFVGSTKFCGICMIISGIILLVLGIIFVADCFKAGTTPTLDLLFGTIKN